MNKSNNFPVVSVSVELLGVVKGLKLGLTNLVDTFEDGPLIMIPTTVQQALNIPFGRPPQGEESFSLRCYQKPALHDCPEKRFDAITIAGGHEEFCP